MPDPAEYDEEEALFHHLVEWGRGELRHEEQFMLKWLLHHEHPKGVLRGDKYARHITRYHERERMPGSEAFDAFIEGGIKGFKAYLLAERLRGARGPYKLNRCLRCDRLPRTPRSKQCPWCYHRWHDSEDAPRDAQF